MTNDLNAQVHTGRVLAEIGDERQRQQQAVHGTRAFAQSVEAWSLEHDDQHTVNDWAALIGRYLGRAGDAAEVAGGDEYRRGLIKVAAITVAAIESLDRAREFAGR